MVRVRAVIFDLDHTLFDTEKTERHALAAVAKAAKVPLGRHALEAYRTINTHVWGVFLITGLDKIFDVYDDVASGLASLQLP